MKNIHLLIIDPQVDFCDPQNGTLYVKGSEDDISRLSLMLDKMIPKLQDIHVTLDSHHLIDIAHPVFWKDKDGNNPAPFTIITARDVESGNYNPTLLSTRSRVLEYLKTLETKGRYPHVIWPPHCLIGSSGHNVVPELFEVLKKWEEERFALVDYVTKGSNPWTEHFSAVQAEVPDPSDPDTQVNVRLIETLEQADLILLAGEAGSHCLANTVRDIATHFTNQSYIKKMVLLTDATSPVTGFEQYQKDFIKDMTSKGMQLGKTSDF